MNEWISTWRNEHGNEEVNEWISEWRNEQGNEWVNEWISEWGGGVTNRIRRIRIRKSKWLCGLVS